MSDNTTQETADDLSQTEAIDTSADAEVQDDQQTTDDGDTFPREYVEKLRNENADYRTRAKTADDLAKRLHTELVRASGKLADPSDLPFDADHLDDPDKLAASIDQLISDKPHLKARRVEGNIGQGESSANTGVNLLDIMRGQA